ncbi:MAG: hypothetical protein JST68_27205 [Bacteroidetes bacterium]|nr:hypothetical protein [Bacteroidota bacterium]
MGIKLSAADHIDFIRKGAYPDAKIKQLMDDGTLSGSELVKLGVFTQERLDQLLYVSPQQHMDHIKAGNYSQDKIRALLEEGIIQEHDLIGQRILSPEALNEIMKRPVNAMMLDFDWKDVPKLMEDRVDVFVLGVAGSGKSTFMSGLIYYAEKAGRMKALIENTTGYKYSQDLITAVENRLLLPATPVEYIQYMACDFKDDSSKIHPLTFIEMSGEVFQKCFSVSKEQLPEKFKQYFFESPNNKIIFLTIDYNIHEEKRRMAYSQRSRFDFILQFFAKHGTLASTEAICILITKWDENKDQSEDAAARFLKQEYLGLYNLCREYERTYGLKFIVFPFSLGKFDERKRYEYNDRDSARLFNWLCSFSSIRIPPKKAGWFSRMFGSNEK